MKKQLLSILLCLIMVVGLLPTAALAEEAAPAFNLETDLAGIEIPDDLVTCICTTTGERKSYGQLSNGFSASKSIEKEGDVWTVIISVESSIYMAQFNEDMDCEHAPDMNHSTDFTTRIQFKLKYEQNKWMLHGEMPRGKELHFTCGGGHVYQGAAPAIKVVTRTSTDIKVTENSAWEYSIDNGANWQDSCHFTNLQPGTEYSIIARVKQTATHQPSANSEPLLVTTMHTDISAALKDKLRAVASAYEGEYNGKEHEAVIVYTTNLPTGWTIAGYSTDGGNNFSNDIPKIKDAGTLGVGVKFVHPDYLMNITHSYTAKVTPTTITEGDLARLDIPANLVTVKCKTTGDSKAYGRIHGGFDLSKSKPYMDNGVLKAIVNLNLPAYKAKYDADTGKTHQNEGLGNTSTPAFTLKYVNSKWMIDGNFPAVVLLVTCNGSHENQITFDGNGGRPTNSTMTTTGKKLASLPIATRSGRYSFDGWYTKKNGGTKITTATLFDKDTTVYAHWTYTGSTGGGVTTYPITVKSAKNGDVTASHKSAAKGTTITLTVDPDKGYVLDTLTVLDGKDKEIKLTEKNGKYTFTMPASKVTVAATFKASAPTGKNPFVDVPAGSYYEDAVIWAVDKGITTGTSATTFNPNGICTRAQAVTFLWRAAGSPAAKSAVMPFADVKAGSYYYDAVLWAVEQGITKGTSDTTFSPDATCSRAQIVAFLWRSEKSPAAGTANPFADVKAGSYYYDAVLWAVEQGITKGTSDTTFSPDATCSRAQIVAFLWRSEKSPAAGTANPFADVKSTAYYADAVLWAVKEDITKGTTSTTFSPDADCTRAQIVTFLYRAFNK